MPNKSAGPRKVSLQTRRGGSHVVTSALQTSPEPPAPIELSVKTEATSTTEFDTRRGGSHVIQPNPSPGSLAEAAEATEIEDTEHD